MTDNLNEEFQKYRDDIQRILDKTARPDDKVPDADVREVLEVVKKIGALGKRLRASVDAAREPEPQPDPLAAGTKLHALAQAAIKASDGKLSYSEAFAGLVLDHWPLVQEWQQSVHPPRRRRG